MHHGPVLSLSIETPPAPPDAVGGWITRDTPPATLPAVGGVFAPAQINQVLEWIVAGNTEHDIREAIAKNYPGVDASGLIARAMMSIAEDSSADSRGIIAWTFAAARHIHRKSIEANDFGGALKSLKFIQDTAVRLTPMNGEEDVDVSEASEG